MDKETPAAVSSPDTNDALNLSDGVDGSREDSQSSVVCNMEEMEVKVDPMIFLECDLEELSSEEYSTDESESNEEKCKNKKSSDLEKLALVLLRIVAIV